MKLNIWEVALFFVVVVAIIGCFLPWGKLNPSPYNSSQDVRVGTWLFPGIYTLASLVFATIFQSVLMIKKKPYVILAALAMTLVASFITGTWILYPTAREYGSGGTYTVLYGAYLTLASSLLGSATAFLYSMNLKKGYSSRAR